MKKRQKGFERNLWEKFIITAIIPVMLLLFVFTCFMWVSFGTMLRWKTEEAGEVIGEKVRELDAYYREQVRIMAESPETLEFLKTGERSERVFEEYYQSVLPKEIRFELLLADADKNICLRTSRKDHYRLDYSFLPVAKLAEEGKRTETRIFSRVAEGELTYYYGYGAVVYDGEIPAGYAIYYVSDRNLKGLLESMAMEEAVITNQFDTVLVTTSESARNPYNKLAYERNQPGKLLVDGRKYYMSVYPLTDIGFRIYVLGSRVYEGYFMQIIPPFLLVVLLGLFVLMYHLSRDMSRRVVEPIEKLMEAVKKTGKGQFDVNVELNTGDEFELLAGEYNRMVKEVDRLIETNSRMAELQRTAEFKMIRNQFNPHFIFNVLETLRYMMFVDAREAERTILALSKFLRYNLYNQDKFVPLWEDMEHMEDFFVLHKARFQERMNYEIQVEEGAGKVLVPKFFIQPFAENSIKYGFQHKDRFSVSVRVWMEGRRLFASVKDDGGGMPEEKFQEVLRRLDSEEKPDDHIGLYNSNRVLKMIYGEEYGLVLENEAGGGFSVTVELPAREE